MELRPDGPHDVAEEEGVEGEKSNVAAEVEGEHQASSSNMFNPACLASLSRTLSVTPNNPNCCTTMATLLVDRV